MDAASALAVCEEGANSAKWILWAISSGVTGCCKSWHLIVRRAINFAVSAVYWAACSVDGDSIAAVALSVVEGGVHKELTVGRLVEVEGTANAEEVPVEGCASADSIEVDVLLLWEERAFGSSRGRACSSKDGAKVETEMAVMSMLFD